MPAVSLSPIFNGWQGFSVGGLPLSGGKLYSYLAGTSTPHSTYTTVAGSVANSNPIILQADGRPAFEIWLEDGVAYKFVLTDSLGLNTLTYDNISGSASLVDLSNTSSVNGGSGLVGFNATLAYASTTIGAHARNHIHVKDYPFLAVGDGVADDTAAVQAALNYVGTTLGGGIVDGVGGRYRITSKLTIPSFVLFQGAEWLPDPSNLQQSHHSAIYVDFGSGSALGSGNHAVEVNLSSGIHGFTFWYPGQVAKTAATPTSFDYSISTPLAGTARDNISIKNITLFNSYAGINLVNGGRWRVENIQGDPLFKGINASSCFDVCYMRGVHFWNFYTQSNTLETWVAANCVLYDFGRIDQLFGESLFGWNCKTCFSLEIGRAHV